MIKLIIFDFNRTLFDFESKELIPGCIDMLKKLSDEYDLVVISTKQKGRASLIHKLLIGARVSKIDIVKEKTVQKFQKVLTVFNVNPSEVVVVGDYIKEEIAIGNKLGLATVWYKRGKFSNLKPTNQFEKADFIVTELNYNTLMNVLNKIN